MRSFKKYLIWGILLLALIGLSYELMTNPIGFITRILVGIGIITVLVLLFRLFMAKRSSASPFLTKQSFRSSRISSNKAGRTSHLNNIQSINKSTKGRRLPKRALNRKNHHHLTVIEGKKNKKKSRALF